MTDFPTDDDLRRILTETQTIACLGVSAKTVRPSYYVARYMKLKGKRVIPVNPGHAGKTLFGEIVRASLRDIPEQIDMLDVFRQSAAVPEIVDEALKVLPGLKVIWLQIGVQHDEAAAKARAAGIEVVQNRCPKIEYQRLYGELRMGGFATGVISSKL